jgi:uncharacterized protein
VTSPKTPPEGAPRPVLLPGMKPVDHPDFFRLPPPPGRSRESAIVLDAQGRFWNGGVLIDHPGMALAFASWIRRHPGDGRFILENGYDWTYLAVEDAPFFIRGLSISGEHAIVQLSDGTEEELDPSSLQFGDGDALYARVKGGAFEAKFTPSAQAALVDLVVEADDGTPVVEWQARRYPIAARPP